ncbi:MAG: hypothetical protein IKH57_02120 [Clostridia bacterium]|nr:hypothetical protein [Clostridia bacterium]
MAGVFVYCGAEFDPLQNRTLHIRSEFKKQNIESSKQYIDSEKQYIGESKQYIEKMVSAGLYKRSAENAAKLYAVFGLTRFFGRSEVVPVLEITITPASSLLKKMTDAGITEAVSGMGKGKYRFNPAFFRPAR